MDILIAAGADVNMLGQDEYDNPPSYYADHDGCELLQKNGTNINVENLRGSDPMMQQILDCRFDYGPN